LESENYCYQISKRYLPLKFFKSQHSCVET
jgi:hypothetical protein